MASTPDNTTEKAGAEKPKRRFFWRNKTIQPDSEHVGKVAAIQTFYESPYTEGGPGWVEWASPSLPAPKKKKFEGAAIQVYKSLRPGVQSGASDDDRYYTSSIRLQSPFLRDALEEDLEIQGLKYDTKGQAESKEPHRALFFCREKIAEVAKSADNDVTRSHCELLCEVIEKHLAPALDAYEMLEHDGMITFEHLWILFPLESLFTTRIRGILNSYRIKSVSATDESLTLQSQVLRFNGCRFGTEKVNMRPFPRFEGKMEVSKLLPFPFIDVSKHREIREHILARAKVILEYQTPRLLSYIPGKNTLKDADDSMEKDRVMIDCYLHFKERNWSVEPFPGYAKYAADKGELPQDKDGSTGDIGNWGSRDEQSSSQLNIKRPTAEEIQRNRDVILEDEENLLVMSPIISAYSLKKHTWQCVSVETLQHLDLQTDVFDKVVFDEKKKEILRVLTKGYAESTTTYDDLITGKGQCLLILLSGEPGTGKTLLAESLADHLERPLLRIASVMPDRSKLVPVPPNNAQPPQPPPWSISSEFRSKIKMASEWSGLLLFDEANFVVENRESGGGNNSISTFLRHIEYFKGIVLLTTNVTADIDSALRSRVQIHLTFSNLTFEMRTKVWQNFVERAPENVRKLDDQDVRRLSEWQMNGRDIKNAFNMAVAWCRKRDVPLTVEAVEDLIALVSPFAAKEVLADIRNGVKKTTAMEDLSNSLLDL